MHEDIISFPRRRAEPFYVLMCGTSYCDGSYRIERPNASFYCFEYIVSGRGYVQVDGERFTAEAGDVYILPARRDHYYYSDAEDPWEKVWCNVGGKLIDGLLQAYGLTGVLHIRKVDVYALFARFLRDAARIRASGGGFEACGEDFFRIVQSLYTHICAERTAPASGSARRLREKLDTLTDYSCSFDELLRGFYCTKSHLIRCFKAEYGITPYAYLLGKKADEAQMLLKDTAMSVGEIADRLGFTNPHYFSAFFKLHVGVPPRAFRRGAGV